MYAIIVRSFCFVALIIMGYLLRRIGFFKQDDFKVLSKIVIRITLTGAIIASFAGNDMEASMFLLTLIGLGSGLFICAVAAILNKPLGADAQAFSIVNSAGYNIGNFVLPFAQGFLGPVAVMAVGLFDMGNAFITLGGAYGIGAAFKDSSRGFSMKPLLSAMSKSPSLIAYIVLTFMSLLHIPVPGVVKEFAGIIGNGNAFLAMLAIGVGFSFSAKKEQISATFRVLATRIIISVAFAVISFTILPFPLEYRQALVLCFLAPIPGAAPAFTGDLGSDYGLACAVNSMSIIISIVMMVGALMIIL